MLQDVATISDAVIPGWCHRVRAMRGPMTGSSTRPQMRNCASGNLEIPGSIPDLGFTRVRQIWLSKSATADLDAHRPGMTGDKSPKDMAPRVRRGAIALLLEGQEENGKSELHSDAAIDGRLGTGMVAHAGRDVAGRAVLVVETELVLPVAVGHPDVDKVRIFRT